MTTPTAGQQSERELLDCPFCGAEPKCWGEDNHTMKLCVVACPCGAHLGYQFTRAEAIAAWNRRAPALSLNREAEAQPVEVRPDEDGEVDEIVMLRGMFHLERLDTNKWWVSLNPEGYRDRLTFVITGQRTKCTITEDFVAALKTRTPHPDSAVQPTNTDRSAEE